MELVQFPAVVLNAGGEFCAGLTAADFEITVDGAPRRTEVAYEVNLHRERSLGVNRPPTAEVSPDVLPIAARRHFLFVFDLAFTPNAAATRARTTAAEFVRNGLAGSDLVAVATLTPQAAHLLSPFTSDHESAARAITTLRPRPGVGTDIVPSLDDEQLDGAVARSIGASTEAQVRLFMAHLQELVDMLRVVLTRTQIVFFSAGFRDDLVIGPDSAEVRARLRDLTASLEASNAALHSVDPIAGRGESRMGRVASTKA